jgi:hypothetical protein
MVSGDSLVIEELEPDAMLDVAIPVQRAKHVSEPEEPVELVSHKVEPVHLHQVSWSEQQPYKPTEAVRNSMSPSSMGATMQKLSVDDTRSNRSMKRNSAEVEVRRCSTSQGSPIPSSKRTKVS